MTHLASHTFCFTPKEAKWIPDFQANVEIVDDESKEFLLAVI